MWDAGHQHHAPTAIGWTQHFRLQALMLLKDICVDKHDTKHDNIPKGLCVL